MKTAILAGGAAFAITAATLAFAQQPAAAPEAEHHRMMTEPQKRADVAAKIRTHFAEVDANKDGFVTQAEVDAKMAAHHAERKARMFDRLDTNKDGQISRQEFTAERPRGDGDHGGMKGMHGGDRGMHKGMGLGGRMLAMADANKDGKVSLQEATDAGLKHFDMADANKDGTVTPDERRQMHQKMHGAKPEGAAHPH